MFCVALSLTVPSPVAKFDRPSSMVRCRTAESVIATTALVLSVIIVTPIQMIRDHVVIYKGWQVLVLALVRVYKS